MLHDMDVNRQAVAFDDRDIVFHEFIVKEIKNLIELCSTHEK